MKAILFYSLLIIFVVLTSCESEQEKKLRLLKAEKQRIELTEISRREELHRAAIEKQERIIQDAREEERRKERETYEKYINNSLQNGSTPYAYCYGRNKSCSDYGCSQIKVKTPYNSDVLVTIKENGTVIRHAYIAAGCSFTFEFPNGTYQAFFYYGKGWNPEKFMKYSSCGDLKGGFVSDEQFGKDTPQTLNNNILEYELILQQNGNFSTKPSNQEDAL
jgi:hypothetical protein